MEMQEDFREVFTYENFKRQILIIDQQNQEIKNIKEEVQELKSLIQEIVETNGKKFKDDWQDALIFLSLSHTLVYLRDYS